MDQVLAPAYETSHHITAVSLASQSLGVAIVSSGMLVVAASVSVVVRRIQGPLIARTLQVIKRRAHELSAPAVESAIDRVGSEWHARSKRAKDTGSVAVLLSLLCCGDALCFAVVIRAPDALLSRMRPAHPARADASWF